MLLRVVQGYAIGSTTWTEVEGVGRETIFLTFPRPKRAPALSTHLHLHSASMAPKRKAADKADAPSKAGKSKVAKKAEQDSAPAAAAAAAATGGVVIEACKS